MKKLLLTIVLLTGVICSYAQNPLPVGRAQLNAGLGFSDWGVPIYLGLDFGAARDFTVGGELSFRSYRDNFNGVGYGHSIIGLSANGNYHFNTVLDMPSDWDFYAGLNLGFYSWTSSSDYPGNRSSGISLGAQIGGRYYFTQKVGLNLELGGGNAFSGGKIGLTFKL
jgi:outer membrane immunogenic protein